MHIDSTIQTIPVINIMIDSSSTETIKDLIHYWLSLNNNIINTTSTCSKIFWIDKHPIQMNIYDLTCNNSDLPQCHAYVRIIIDNEQHSPWKHPDIPEYSIQIESSIASDSSINLPFRVIDIKSNVPLMTSFKTNDNELSLLLDEITRRAFQSSLQNFYSNQYSNNKQKFSSIYQRTPNKIRYLEDEFYVLNSTETVVSCCNLI